MKYVVLIALALLLFVGEEAAGGFLNLVAVCLKYGLPIGSGLVAVSSFCNREIIEGLGWTAAAIFWAWVFW